jgi:DHA2 family methylenomycin A resistance protein-like MFS transporter
MRLTHSEVHKYEFDADTSAAETRGVAVHTQPVATRTDDAPWNALATISVGLFLAVLSTTMVSVALPTIGRDLHATTADLEWVVDAYVVVYATLLITGGALGDRFPRRALFALGVGLFGLGSMIAGVAPLTGVLLLGRVVQGLGAAFLVPGSLTIIRTLFTEPRQRATAIGVWSTGSGLALAVGPPLGGLLVDTAGWRGVFLINVPLVLGVLLAIARYVPDLPVGRAVVRGFDWPGMLLPTLGIGALAFGVIEGQALGWQSSVVALFFVIGLVSLGAFVVWELAHSDPLIDVRLFKRPGFSAANLAAFAVFFAFVGAIVYFSAYFQQVQGLSAAQAGFEVAAIGIAYAIAAMLSGRAVGRLGERWPLLLGLLICGVAMLGLVRLEPETAVAAVWADFALLGFGSGLCGTPMSTLAMSSVDVSRAGMASAVINAVRQVGQVFGVAVLGAVVYAHLPSAAGQALGPVEQALFMDGLHQAVLLAALVLLVTAVFVAALLRKETRATSLA